MFDSTFAGGKKRFFSGLMAAGLQAGLVIVLVYGLAPPVWRAGVNSPLTSLDVFTPPPPPPPERHVARRAGPAAEPARRAEAAPFVAPRVAPLNPPPVIPVAPVAGEGMASAGAAVTGNGSGAGGQGNGTGAGGAGDGGGGGEGAALVSGRIDKPSDIPANMRNAPFSGTTSALVIIDAAGKVVDCRTRRSSGNLALDALTCRLIVARLSFRAARDPAGRAIAGKIIYEHDWEVGGGFDSDPPG